MPPKKGNTTTIHPPTLPTTTTNASTTSVSTTTPSNTIVTNTSTSSTSLPAVPPSSSSTSIPNNNYESTTGYLRIVEKNKQYEASLPDAVFQYILVMLPPEQIARCMSVCHRWNTICGDEKLWKKLCKDTIQRYHPDPTREKLNQKALYKELATSSDWIRHNPPSPSATLISSSSLRTRTNIANHNLNSTSTTTTTASNSSFSSNIIHQGLSSGIYITNDNDDDDDDTSSDDNDSDNDNNELDPEVQEHLVRRNQSNTSTNSTNSSLSYYRTNTGTSINSDSLSASYLDNPSTTNDDVSLSLAKQAYLNSKKERRQAIKLEIERITKIRNEMIDDFKKYVIQIKSFRNAFRTIPCIRHNGIYTLQSSYVRKGVRDMFHAVAGILKVTYHRTFWFREDGTLLYAMIPGQAFESIREFRRIANNLANNIAVTTNASNTTNNGTTLLPSTQSITSLSRDRILNLNTKDLNTTIGKGWYTIEGRILNAEVITANNLLTRWKFEINSTYNGFNDRLTVLSFTLLEPGADPGAETPITQLNGEQFEFRNTPVIA